MPSQRKTISRAVVPLAILLGIVVSIGTPAESADEKEKGHWEAFAWKQQGARFFGATSIWLRVDFQNPKEAVIVFDGNNIGYDAFGDWKTTLQAFPPHTCKLVKIEKKDPLDRRLFEVELPKELAEKHAKKHPGERLRMSLSAVGSERFFLRLLSVKEGKDGKIYVKQVADFYRGKKKKPAEK